MTGVTAGTTTITVTGKISTTVKGECTVTVNKARVKLTAEQIANNPKEYYGKAVVNYKANDNDTNVYRIFYVDTEGENGYFGDGKNTIYLKADYFGGMACSTVYNANTTKIREMNPLWAVQRGNAAWRANEKASAWLCDTSQWASYCNSNYANYAIGGPSVEMYVKSYNQAYQDVPNTYVLGTSYNASTSPGYIYTLNGNQSPFSKSYFYTSGGLDYTLYNSMYCGKNGTKIGNWWLASPSSNSKVHHCNVLGDDSSLYSYGYNGVRGISPLISLQSSFIPEIEE